MDEDPLAGILGEKPDLGLDENTYRPARNNPAYDGGDDPEVHAADLLAACKANDAAKAQDFLADGVPPGYSDPESGWSCLHWSVYNRNPVLTRALISAGAASDYKRASATLTQGRKTRKHTPLRTSSSSLSITDTPLHWSAYQGDLGITWILLKEGYSPNDKDTLGNTAAHLAAANGHERVLDTLIRDGADVHKQNKFKNTPHDVANSVKCRGLLRAAEALPAPSPEQAENMHANNLQRILEAEIVLIEALGPSEPTDEEKRRRHRQGRGQQTDGVQDGDMEEAATVGSGTNSHTTGKDSGEGGGADPFFTDKNAHNESRDGESGDDAQKQQNVRRAITSAEEKKGETGEVAGGDENKQDGKKGEDNLLATTAERKDGDDGHLSAMSKGVDGEVVTEGCEVEDGERGADGDRDSAGGLRDQVERIREAVAGVEALCICDDLVAAATLKIEGLLLQHSIEKQAARVAAAGPILTQEAYTTHVNRLVLLLRRAEGNPRITGTLCARAKALVDKSHAEYWLQVSNQRLLKVECAEARHVGDMAKLEVRIEKAAKFGAQSELVCGCRSLLRRLTTEVEISKAIGGFPTVRLPIEVMPKDYWQPEDLGHIEETEGFPLPPVDPEGKSLDYAWVPSTSLRALSAACKRMSNALVGGEGLNQTLVERGSKKLHEVQKELRVLQEKDTSDKEKAVSVAAKAAKKLKKKGGKKKKK